MELYIHRQGQTSGPFTEEQVIGKIEDGSLSVSDLAMVSGQSDSEWHPLSSFIEEETDAHESRITSECEGSTFVLKDGVQTGPFTDAEIKARLQSGVLAPSDLAWREGWQEWQPLSVLYPSFSLRNAPPVPSTRTSKTQPPVPPSVAATVATTSPAPAKATLEKVLSRVLMGFFIVVGLVLLVGVVLTNFMDSASWHTFLAVFRPQSWREAGKGFQPTAKPMPLTLQMQQALADKVSKKLDHALKGAMDQIATQDLREKKEPTGISSVDHIRILKESIEELGYSFEATLMDINRSQKDLDGSLFVTELLNPVRDHLEEARSAGLISPAGFDALSPQKPSPPSSTVPSSVQSERTPAAHGPIQVESTEAAKSFVSGTWTYIGAKLDQVIRVSESIGSRPEDNPHRIHWLKWVVKDDGTIEVFDVAPSAENWGKVSYLWHYTITSGRYADTGDRYYAMDIVMSDGTIPRGAAVIIPTQDKLNFQYKARPNEELPSALRVDANVLMTRGDLSPFRN